MAFLPASLRRGLLPEPPRSIPRDRLWRTLARALHLTAMGVLLGGVAFRIDEARLEPWSLGTLATGFLLLGFDLYKSCAWLAQGSGAAFLVKLLLLGCGFLRPAQRFAWYLAATVVAGIGAHMAGRWRHHPWLPWGRVNEDSP